MKRFHAWYSETMVRFSGTVIYRREDGTEVEVTAVGEFEKGTDTPPISWPDAEYVGVVTESSRPGREATEKMEEIKREPLPRNPYEQGLPNFGQKTRFDPDAIARFTEALKAKGPKALWPDHCTVGTEGVKLPPIEKIYFPKGEPLIAIDLQPDFVKPEPEDE